MNTTRCWFVRHGESTANAEGWLAGHRDAPLTERGIAEAAALREALKPLSPARVRSSDLIRTHQTARLAWGGRLPELVIEPALRERHLGQWEGRTIASLVASGEMETLMSFDLGPPGGESHAALAVRALSFLTTLDDGQPTLLFSHGGWIRTVLGLLDGMPREEIGRFKIANTGLHMREVPRGRFAALLDAVR